MTCTKHSCGVISLTSLGQPTIRLRRYDGKRQRKEVYGEKRKKKNNVEEIQLANFVRPSQAKMQPGSIRSTLRVGLPDVWLKAVC